MSVSEISPHQILLDAFADELEKVGGMEKEALFGLLKKAPGAATKGKGWGLMKGLQTGKGWLGKWSLGLTALFLPSTMKGTARAAMGRAPKHVQMLQNVGQPRPPRGFH